MNWKRYFMNFEKDKERILMKKLINESEEEDKKKYNAYVKTKILNNQASLPVRQTKGSCAFDLTACIEDSITINPGETILIPTGIAINIGDLAYKQSLHVAAMIIPRSGLGHKHGIILGNSVGLIDQDYQGEIKVSLYNRGKEPYTVNPLDRIAQMLFVPVIFPILELVEEFEPSDRGSGGFGSTGV